MGQLTSSLYNTHFLSAAQSGDVAEMEKYLALGASINTHDAADNTALLLAATKGDEKTLRFCFDHNAARDWRNDIGNTALLAAINGGQEAAAQLLLKEKFNAAAKNHADDNAMTLAATRGLFTLLPLLQAQGLDIDAADGGGHTALMRVLYADNARAGIEMLINLGADINARDKLAQTPLIHAARAGKAELAGLLLKLGAKADLTDSRGVSAADVARQWHNDDMVAEFKAAFGRYDVPQFSKGTRSAMTPLHTVRFRKP